MRDVKVDHIHQKPTIFEVLMSKTHIEFLKKLKKFKKNLKIWANGTKARHTSAKKNHPKVAQIRSRDGQNCIKIVYMACMLHTVNGEGKNWDSEKDLGS